MLKTTFRTKIGRDPLKFLGPPTYFNNRWR